ncbi:transposase [Subsaximicrobium wynnwilliamsii]|nr:transposase [Subsaximicrobium wynnwilliamsii]
MKNRKGNRMKGYDYSRNNLYFVTICVDQMKCCLGQVVDADLIDENHPVGTGRDLSVHSDSKNNPVGTGRDLSARRADAVHPQLKKSKEFSIVPSRKVMELNAYGKIVEERLQWLAGQYQYVVLHNYVVMPNHVHAIIEINKHLVTEVGIKIKSLSELVGAFKSTSSKWIHELNFPGFKWKRSFHDSIIKEDRAHSMISNYISENPNKWINDKFYA